jgi:dTDP-4-dehydrorhamnose reductase
MHVTGKGRPIEVWGGPECTLNRVGDRYFDQLTRSGHAHRLDDLDRFAHLGITALRYPVLWERVAPGSLDAPSWQWTDERLERIRELGMRPIAGLLHHGSGPRYTSLIDPSFPEQLGRYAAMVACRYPWLADYTPVNEPLTTARFSGLYGLWYPQHRDTRSFVRALLNQVRGTALAMQAIRRVNPTARLIQTEDCGRCYGTRGTQSQVAFENHRRWLTWDLLCGRVDAQHPLYKFLTKYGASPAELDWLCAHPTPPQVIGLNYYVTSDRFLDDRLDRYPAETHGGNGRIAYADVEAVRVRREGLTGHATHLLDAWHRYQLPVALTEVHLACTREEQARWLVEAWHAASTARDQGADVVAITPWALLGSFDWDSLVTQPRGNYEPGAFDVRAPKPRPTAVGNVIRQLATGIAPSDAMLTGPGWWRRPERLLHPHGVTAEPEMPVIKPLVILGASGTLGAAFRRIAAQRGLAVHCVDRRSADITDAAAVERALSALDPSAVVNATGYVRVDEAEGDSETCFSVNTIGAVNVASACARLGVPLVTYSSDLVFDGERGEPYTENDTPRPLNIYGASKAEAERRVLSLMPRALVIRTSAFFGPWDRSNFVIQTLDAIRRGERVAAAADLVVSPTYVPDLVHATLDLLIDGERGVWHVANEGAVSWFEFARAAAHACGERSHLIDAVAAADLGWPAPRPAYSALSSVRGRVMRSTDAALAAFAATTDWREAPEHVQTSLGHA